MGLAGAEREDRMERYCLISIEFQLFKMTKVIEMDGGDGCTILQMYVIPLNCTFKVVRW